MAAATAGKSPNIVLVMVGPAAMVVEAVEVARADVFWSEAWINRFWNRLPRAHRVEVEAREARAVITARTDRSIRAAKERKTVRVAHLAHRATAAVMAM